MKSLVPWSLVKQVHSIMKNEQTLWCFLLLLFRRRRAEENNNIWEFLLYCWESYKRKEKKKKRKGFFYLLSHFIQLALYTRRSDSGQMKHVTYLCVSVFFFFFAFFRIFDQFSLNTHAFLFSLFFFLFPVLYFRGKNRTSQLV